jgi:signal transduction histidine kinase
MPHTKTESAEKMTALVQLAGTVAHELNNIFTAVAGNLSLLDQDVAGNIDRSMMFRDIAHAAQRGIELTSKLQAFAGRQWLNRQNIELNAIVSRTMRGLHSSLPGVNVKISLAGAEFIIYTDKQKLADTLTELVQNARAALPPVGGCITVETSRRQNDGAHPYVMLRVSDNGCGMPPDVVARAVEPLFSTRPEGIRRGWGLSNCVGFIRQSGGNLSISSEPGQGSVVEISLPLENC